MPIAELKNRTKKFELSEINFLNKDIVNTLEKIQTPFYFYDTALLHKTLRKLREAANKNNYHVHYAIKANANDKILKIIKDYGLGADCVSGNEIKKAVFTGFQSEKIVFAGVGKTDKEIITALENKIFCLNCESTQEVCIINQLACEMGVVANIAFRINPDIDAGSHPYISTGMQITKFGMGMDDIKWLVSRRNSLSNINFLGIHFHIGSQITDLSVYKNLCFRANEIVRWLTEQDIKIDHINMGGGLGVDYDNPDNNLSDFVSFFDVFKKHLHVNDRQIVHFELGRSVVAQSGNLITKVLFVKIGNIKKFIIVDAGFTELIRPSLYQSFHKISNLKSSAASEVYDVVGPICETTDCFGKSLSLPITQRGDIIIIRSTGAYGEVMSSGYNLREASRSYYSDDLLF
jgi:diaminopimelate decarboxylase